MNKPSVVVTLMTSPDVPRQANAVKDRVVLVHQKFFSQPTISCAISITDETVFCFFYIRAFMRSCRRSSTHRCRRK